MPGWARTIAPGEESEIKVEFHTAGKSNRQTKRITVSTNDPQHSRFVFTLKGNIFEPIDVSPPAISVRANAGDVVEKSVTITNNLEHPLELGDIRYPDDIAREKMTLTLDKHILQPNEKAELSVVVDASEAGRLFKTFNISTDYMKKPNLPIRVNVFIQDTKKQTSH